MDFSFTEEQQALRDLARQIFADKATVERIVEIERHSDDRIDRDLWAALAAAQLLGVAIPEEFGGLGFTMLELRSCSNNKVNSSRPFRYCRPWCSRRRPLPSSARRASKIGGSVR